MFAIGGYMRTNSGGLFSSTTVYDSAGRMRYFCFGSGDTRPKEPLHEEAEAASEIQDAEPTAEDQE